MFGDGFFTTGVIEGNQLLNAVYHKERLLKSAKMLLFVTYDGEALFDALNRLLISVEKASIRITVTRTQFERGYAISSAQDCLATIQVFPWVATPESDCQVFYAETPVSVNSKLAGLKHLNRLDNVLAASEITQKNQEALLCDNELIVCGSRTNLFIASDKGWVTPLLKRAGIEGITRRLVLQSMVACDIPVKEKDISRLEMENAKAAFLTNSLVGIWPISRLGNKKLATDLVQQLQFQLNFIR